jgi:Family of unknown function (DUF5519)
MEADKHTHQVTEMPSTTIATDAQSILRITLSGPSLVLTILTLIISIHLIHPSLMATIIALAPLPCIVHNDYKAFLSLGPGGTPSTFSGYLKIVYLRLFALSDPYTPPPVLGTLCPSTGSFQSRPSVLPQRLGPRPRIAGIAPQRQLDQWGCPTCYVTLRRALENAALKYPQRLQVGVSCFEKKGIALFAVRPLNSTCRGEICHVHYSDRSLHLNLHPQDAKVILESGWGQRHPLAKGGWMSKYVPKEFVMVYAPRDTDEVEVVARIIEAAAWWVMGERIDITVPKRMEVSS